MREAAVDLHLVALCGEALDFGSALPGELDVFGKALIAPFARFGKRRRKHVIRRQHGLARGIPVVQREFELGLLEQALGLDDGRAARQDGPLVVFDVDFGDLAELERVFELLVALLSHSEYRLRYLKAESGGDPIPVTPRGHLDNDEALILDTQIGNAAADDGFLEIAAARVDRTVAKQRHSNSGLVLAGGVGLLLAIVGSELAAAQAPSGKVAHALERSSLLDAGAVLIVAIFGQVVAFVAGLKSQVKTTLRHGTVTSASAMTRSRSAISKGG